MLSTILRPDFDLPQPTLSDRVRDLVMRHGWNSTCYQAVNPNLNFRFYPDLDAVVAYVSTGHHRVIAGAPICPAENLAEVTSRFESEADKPTIYFGAGPRFRELSSAGVVSLGAQPVWNPQTWAERILEKRSLRYQFSRANTKGVEVREWSTREAENSSELQAVLDEWLSARPLPPLHFLVEPQVLDNLRDRRTFVASLNGKPVAFLNLCPVPARKGWLTEQFPRTALAPNGTVELLIHEAVQAVASEGAEYLTMGLVPGSHEGTSDLNPAWLRLLVRAARKNSLYNLDGLDDFKSKFLPELWEPIYAVTPNRRFHPSDLFAIFEAFTRSGNQPKESERQLTYQAIRPIPSI